MSMLFLSKFGSSGFFNDCTWDVEVLLVALMAASMRRCTVSSSIVADGRVGGKLKEVEAVGDGLDCLPALIRRRS